jgi:hypothetical protein
MVMVLSVFAVAGCSSTQPDRIETRLASLGVSASASVLIFDCYQVWQDVDGDGVPETDTATTQCFPTFEPQNPIQVRKNRAVPWPYSLQVTVIPAGSVSEQVVISSDGATVGSSVEPGDSVEDFISLTDYDPDQPPSSVVNFNTGSTFFLNGKQVSQGSPIYLASIGVDPGVPNILNILNPPETFDFNLNTGDTVVIRARKQLRLAGPPFLPPTGADLRISANLLISGVQATTQGSKVSPVDDGAGFTFSFTVR